MTSWRRDSGVTDRPLRRGILIRVLGVRVPRRASRNPLQVTNAGALRDPPAAPALSRIGPERGDLSAPWVGPSPSRTLGVVRGRCDQSLAAHRSAATSSPAAAVAARSGPASTAFRKVATSSGASAPLEAGRGKPAPSVRLPAGSPPRLPASGGARSRRCSTPPSSWPKPHQRCP